jgi:hypothetical protein
MCLPPAENLIAFHHGLARHRLIFQLSRESQRHIPSRAALETIDDIYSRLDGLTQTIDISLEEAAQLLVIAGIQATFVAQLARWPRPRHRQAVLAPHRPCQGLAC